MIELTVCIIYAHASWMNCGVYHMNTVREQVSRKFASIHIIVGKSWNSRVRPKARSPRDQMQHATDSSILANFSGLRLSERSSLIHGAFDGFASALDGPAFGLAHADEEGRISKTRIRAPV